MSSGVLEQIKQIKRLFKSQEKKVFKESQEKKVFKESQKKIVFISHEEYDFDAARKLFPDLRSAGFSIFSSLPLVPGSYMYGQQLDGIREAIANSPYFIALFSSTPLKESGNMQREIQFALAVNDKFPARTIFAIPVRLNICDIPYEKFWKTKSLDLFLDWNGGVKRLLEIMSGDYFGIPVEKDRPSLAVTQGAEVLPPPRLPPERPHLELSPERYRRSSTVFVCYSRMDGGGFAERIYDYLTDAGYDVFIDVNTIRASDVWSTVIEENISKCNLFVPIITPSALRSAEVEKEVLQALKEKKKVIPCIHNYVRKKEVKWGLGQFQGISFDDKYELALKLSKVVNN